MATNKKTTEGARLLRKYVDRIIKVSRKTITKQTIARQLGESPSTLDHWLTGRRRPTIDQAIMLRRKLRIPVDAWAKK